MRLRGNADITELYDTAVRAVPLTQEKMATG